MKINVQKKNLIAKKWFTSIERCKGSKKTWLIIGLILLGIFISLPIMAQTQIRCSTCGGSGYEDCRICDGTGTVSTKVICHFCNGKGDLPDRYSLVQRNKCKDCNGSGQLIATAHCKTCAGYGFKTCSRCNGKGNVPGLGW
jgi:hypothetical protein